MKHYNRTNTCEKCGNKLINNGIMECDKNNNWTGRWICKDCYDKDYYYRIRKKDPNSQNNIKKSLADMRTGNLNQSSNTAKGLIFEQVTVIVRGVKNLNIENDNMHSKIDHSRDIEFGIIQSKGSTLHTYKFKGKRTVSEFWKFDTEGERSKEFDFLIAYCADKNMKNIERVYIFPKEEVMKRTAIKVYKNTKGWYEKYRVDEKIYNDAYQIIKGE